MIRHIVVAQIDAPGGVVYASTRPYATHPSDTPANLFISRGTAEIVYERALTFEFWSRGGGGATSGVELYNIDGYFDTWPNLAWKGRRINLYAVEPRQAWSTRIALGSMTIHRPRVTGAHRIRLECGSTIELLGRPVNSVFLQTIGNLQLRGQPAPIVLGHVRWADPRPRRLNDGSTRGLYDLTDAPFESVAQVLHRGSPLIEQPDPQLPTGGFWVDADECYGFRFGPQTYRLAGEMHGNLRREANLTTNDTFPTATGDDPAGWDVTEEGTATVVLTAPGIVTITGFGDGNVRIDQTLGLTDGHRYQLEVRVSSQTGTADFYYGATVLRSFEAASNRTVMVCFVAAGGVDNIGVGLNIGQSGFVQINFLRCYRVHRIDSLGEMLRFAAARNSVSTSALALTACDDLQAETPYRLAIATTGAITGDELVRRAALSYGSGFFEDRSGQLRPARLKRPSAVADWDIPEWRVKGDIAFETDHAPGLANRMSFGRNYVLHSDDDMSGITDPAMRAALSRGPSVVTSTITLHAEYAADAAAREPIESLLSEQADAQAEINRLCDLYRLIRGFWSFTVRLDDVLDAYEIEPGETIRLTHRRYGLSAGVNLLVVLARSNETQVDLVCWGSAEPEAEDEAYEPSPIEELIEDTTFDSSSGWTGWLVEDGYAAYDEGELEAELLRPCTPGLGYRLTVDVLASDMDYGLDVYLGDQLIYSGLAPAVGEWTFDSTASGAHGTLTFIPEGGTPALEFGSVSLQELG